MKKYKGNIFPADEGKPLTKILVEVWDVRNTKAGHFTVCMNLADGRLAEVVIPYKDVAAMQKKASQ